MGRLVVVGTTLAACCGFQLVQEVPGARRRALDCDRNGSVRYQKLTVVVNVILRGSGFTKLVRICWRGLPAKSWLVVSVV